MIKVGTRTIGKKSVPQKKTTPGNDKLLVLVRQPH